VQIQRKALAWIAGGAVVVTAGAMGTALALKPPASDRRIAADTLGKAACALGQLTIGAHELTSPAGPSEQLFSVEFAAKPGVSCTLVGYPAGLRFAQPDGAALGLVPNVPAEPATTPVTVGEGSRTAVFYVRVPHREIVGQAAAKATFGLPNGDPHAEAVTVDWPAPLEGTVDLSPVQPPAG
jgi:hypothetical protein